MTTAPLFVLSGPTGTVVAEGIHTAYGTVDAARSALLSGEVPIIVGALPFDVARPCALMRPSSYRVADALPQWPAGTLPAMRVAATVPSTAAHEDRVRQALKVIRDPTGGLRKVVLARAVDVVGDHPLAIETVLMRLAAADPAAYTYLVDLAPAGGDYAGALLVGASPELLVDRDGERVTCRPCAGSAPRSPDPQTDRANGAALAESAKDRLEHALVVDAMRKVLDPLCVDLQIAPVPQLSRTAALWHLSTPISGRLRESTATALDVALALHPTPAVGGVPTDAATAMIDRLEGDRGFYAGATGWCNRRGDGRWVVSIRCAQVSADRRSARAYSGGGIVADSQPADELAETTTKFRTILSALGVPT